MLRGNFFHSRFATNDIAVQVGVKSWLPAEFGDKSRQIAQQMFSYWQNDWAYNPCYLVNFVKPTFIQATLSLIDCLGYGMFGVCLMKGNRFRALAKRCWYVAENRPFCTECSDRCYRWWPDIFVNSFKLDTCIDRHHINHKNT